MEGRSECASAGGSGAGFGGPRTSSRSSGYSGTPIISAARVSPAFFPRTSRAFLHPTRRLSKSTPGREDREGRDREGATRTHETMPADDSDAVIADPRADGCPRNPAPRLV